MNNDNEMIKIEGGGRHFTDMFDQPLEEPAPNVNFYPKPLHGDSSIKFYEIDCPENISDEEEPQLGLGELLEEHRIHFCMEKLSNNFSSSSDKSQAKNTEESRQVLKAGSELLNCGSQLGSNSDVLMRSSDNSSVNMTQGVGTGLGSSSVMMRSDYGSMEGCPAPSGDGDSKMKTGERVNVFEPCA